jgi:hypothetical protein
VVVVIRKAFPNPRIAAAPCDCISFGVASAQMQSEVWFEIGQLTSVVLWIQNSVLNVSMRNLIRGCLLILSFV